MPIWNESLERVLLQLIYLIRTKQSVSLFFFYVPFNNDTFLLPLKMEYSTKKKRQLALREKASYNMQLVCYGTDVSDQKDLCIFLAVFPE